MMRFIFFSLMLLCASPTAWTQTNSADPYKIQFNKAEKLFNLEHPTGKTDSLAANFYLQATDSALVKMDGRIAIGSLIRAGTIRQTHKRFDDAIVLYRKAIVTNLTYFRDTSLLYEACLYIGSVFYQQGLTDSAKYYFEKASLLTTLDTEQKVFPEQDRLYNSLGAIYYESANYSQAMNYFQKALQFDDDEETRVTLQSNIANCFVQLSRYDEGIKLFNTLLPATYLKRIILHNTGHAYFKTTKYDSALKFFSKVTRQNDEVTMRMLIDVGRIYAIKGNYAAAYKSFDSSLQINNILSGKIHNKDRALNYLARSIMADQQNQNSDAVKWCDTAFAELLIGGTVSIVNTISPVLMIDVLKQKASLLEKEFNKTKSSPYLEKCFNTWIEAIRVAAYIRRYLDNDEAKMYFQEDKGEIFLEALRIGFIWMNIKKDNTLVNDLIGIMESYKGNILLENIQQASLKEGSKIPLTIRMKEKTLKQSISYYTVKLGTSRSLKMANELQNNILSARVELSRLQKQYELHPEYDFYKQDTGKTDYLNRLASALDNKTALLCYMLTKENIYALAISRNSYQSHVINLTPRLKSWLGSFNNQIYQHTEGRRYEGTQYAFDLYKELIDPFKNLLKGRQKLVILPDGLLNYIPFEALNAGNDKRDFLLFHKEISYHYSISLLLFNHEHPVVHNTASLSLFLAPFVDGNAMQTAGLSMLPYSVNEVSDVRVTKLVGNKATKKNLLDNISSSRVIHLATHAKAGGGNNGDAIIYLYPQHSSAEANNLYMEEIYSLDFRNTDLVILSACETAGGTNAAGEGLLSLSRAFMYAGSKGMISTLWKTEDQVSARLMQFFYVEMGRGYPAEEALQRAKIRFLNDPSVSEKYKTPNYWSNFIYVGQTGKKVSHFNYKWFYVLAIVMAGVFIYMVYKNNKATPPFQDSFG